MPTIEQILTSLIPTALLLLIAKYADRKKTAAELRKYFREEYLDVIDTLREERKSDRALIDDNKKTIREMERGNEECEYGRAVMELDLQLIKKKIGLDQIPKEVVFILDDNKLVIEDFKRRFGKISSIDYRAFTDADNFLQAAISEKPEAVILDHFLGNDKTAEDILKQLGYEPEVFIMSSDRNLYIKYKGDGVKFFYKGENYVWKIAKAVIDFIKDKN